MTILDSIRHHTMNAPVDVFAIARDLGLQVRRVTLPDNHSAKITREYDGSYTIDLNRRDPETRQRFSLAHEIAHYIYHRELIGDGVSDSPAFRSPDPSVYENTPLEHYHETEANRFAANVLMPKTLVAEAKRQFGSDIPNMANHLGVSVPAMRVRLGLEPYPETHKSLFQ